MKQKKFKLKINRLNISLIVTVAFVIALIISSQWLVKQKTSYRPHAETAGTRYLNPIFTELNITNNISYRQIENTQLSLNLYQPKNDSLSLRPAIVWIHSGGFYSGEKEDIDGLAREFSKRGYVTVAIDYRLATELSITNITQLGNSQAIINAQSDAESAIEWMKKNASIYKVDPNLIFVGGGSAGAVTALYAGFNPKLATKVAGIISIMGVAEESIVKSGSPPVIMLNGKADQIIPIQYVELFQNKIKGSKIPYEFYNYEGVTHGQIPFEDQVLKISQFLAKVVTGQLSPAPVSNNSPNITNTQLLKYFKRFKSYVCPAMNKYFTKNIIKPEDFSDKDLSALVKDYPIFLTFLNKTNANFQSVGQAYLAVCSQ